MYIFDLSIRNLRTVCWNMYQNWGANTKVVSFEQEQFSEMNRDKIPDNTV